MRLAVRLGHALVVSVCLMAALAVAAQAQTIQTTLDVTYGRVQG
jgi:hypothetical protein